MLPTRTRKIATGLLVLFAVAVSHSARSELADPSREGAALQEMVDRIEGLQAREGMLSPELVDPLRALVFYYREHDEHALAAATIERARQIVRVNYGLHSMDEAYLLRQLIETERSRGNIAYARQVEEKLLSLLARHPDDTRTVPLLRDVGDERLGLLDRYFGGEWTPEIVLGCYYDEPGFKQSCQSGSRARVIRSILNEAVAYYSQAINVILQTEGYSNNALPDLLTTLVHVSHEYGMRGVGRESLRHLFSYQVSNEATSLAQLDALVQVVDWNLLFARNRNEETSALEAYSRVYARLRNQEAAPAAIDAFFAPTLPVVLPAFLPNPLASEATGRSLGYIDAAFDITHDGHGRHVEVLDATQNTDKSSVDHLVKLIQRSRFRPRTADGRFTDSRVTLRYYLDSEQDLPQSCRRPSRFAKYGLAPRLCGPD